METLYCQQAALVTHLFMAALHRCAKTATAFSTALNLHGKFEEGITVTEEGWIYWCPTGKDATADE